ncbi:hypothetical protein PI125_g9688 [Phytophthora idaei]|nr:hypothetical protein PI125_g9688 [Phytophthora idaei]
MQLSGSRHQASRPRSGKCCQCNSEAGGDVGRKAHQVARTSCAEGSGARGSEADVEVPIEEFAGDGF